MIFFRMKRDLSPAVFLNPTFFIFCILFLLCFAACGRWLIKDDNVSNCYCIRFNNPVLHKVCSPKPRSGIPKCGLVNVSNVCNLFGSCVLPLGLQELFSLKWDNPTVMYEEVACLQELTTLHCKHPYAIESNMPATCANNIFTTHTPSLPTPTAPTHKPTTRKPTTRKPTRKGYCNW